jgi:hypothetical protein
MHGLKLAGVGLDRKVLADIAVHDGAAFAGFVQQAEAVLAAHRRQGLRLLDQAQQGPWMALVLGLPRSSRQHRTVSAS